MLFSSITFIFLFLPVILLTFYLFPKIRNGILLSGSLLFYAWGEPYYVFIMLLTIFVNYVGALGLGKKKSSFLCGAIITVDLAILFYFKYFNFLIENINLFMSGEMKGLNIVMPIGISFYTFQAISYVIDVYRQEVLPQKSFAKLALYITFFPQLVAGPIVKYHDICFQLEHPCSNEENVIKGIKRFIIGLTKKTIIANTLGAVVDNIFSVLPEQMDTLTAWCGAIFYTLQLFFDFSGYSDMAIGLGLLFGFTFLENFNYPYISNSVTEFWHRWHISLSSWFKQYLYIPLGGNRHGKKQTYCNLFIVFLITGFWHGAAWNFIFWGIWHGVFIILEKIFHITQKAHTLLCRLLQHLYLLLVVIIGWILFRADNLSYARRYIQNMFGLLPHTPSETLNSYIDNTEIIVFMIALLCATPLFKNIFTYERYQKYGFINFYLLGLFFISIVKIALSTYNPFIYFRF